MRKPSLKTLGVRLAGQAPGYRNAVLDGKNNTGTVEDHELDNMNGFESSMERIIWFRNEPKTDYIGQPGPYCRNQRSLTAYEPFS